MFTRLLGRAGCWMFTRLLGRARSWMADVGHGYGVVDDESLQAPHSIQYPVSSILYQARPRLGATGKHPKKSPPGELRTGPNQGLFPRGEMIVGP